MHPQDLDDLRLSKSALFDGLTPNLLLLNVAVVGEAFRITGLRACASSSSGLRHLWMFSFRNFSRMLAFDLLLTNVLGMTVALPLRIRKQGLIVKPRKSYYLG